MLLENLEAILFMLVEYLGEMPLMIEEYLGYMPFIQVIYLGDISILALHHNKYWHLWGKIIFTRNIKLFTFPAA